MQTLCKGHTHTNQRPGQYLTYVHTRITWAVATTDSCFALIGPHEHGKAVGLINERFSKTLTAEVNAKQSIKRQLHTTHLGVVGWEPHSSSTTTCEGKVDHELPVN